MRDLIEARCGLRFDDSQRGSLSSSVAARMQLLGLVNEDEYLDRLRGAIPSAGGNRAAQPAQPGHGHRDLLLSRRRAIPPLSRAHRADVDGRALRNGHGSKKIRIWSAGCSTGEEAYSIAITLDAMGIYRSHPGLAHRDYRDRSQYRSAREGAPRGLHGTRRASRRRPAARRVFRARRQDIRPQGRHQERA